ncbi:hypothetical protein [Mucilaginibacter sp.]
MNAFVKYVYNYLNYKPEVGLISAAGSYVIAMKSIMLTDDTLKIVATISACAACVVSCLTAVSWLVRAVVWSAKTWRRFKFKTRK